MSVGWQPEVQSVFQSCGYAEIVHGGGRESYILR